MISSSNLAPQVIRFVDICAGLGGFHHGLARAGEILQGEGSRLAFRCVLASELDPELRRLYVSNFPDVEPAYRTHYPPDSAAQLAASIAERHPDLSDALSLYDAGGKLVRVHGDLNGLVDGEAGELRLDVDGTPIIPEHELLCAGFPCQPFSKSGSQRGFEDTRGTLFHLIALVIKHRQPDLVLLENVGNFERHDGGNTWQRVRSILDQLGYDVAATEHLASGTKGVGLLSPHHVGLPHHRERFFIIAQNRSSQRFPPLAGRYPFPKIHRHHPDSRRLKASREEDASRRLLEILAAEPTDPARDLQLARVSSDRLGAIEHWGKLLQQLREADSCYPNGARLWRDTMPSFPIWGYELDPWQWYPIDANPLALRDAPARLAAARQAILSAAASDLIRRTDGQVDLRDHPPHGARAFLSQPELSVEAAGEWVASWPGYAGRRSAWPQWKVRFIEQNREFALRLWSSLDPTWMRAWLDTLYTCFPAASHQKLEWNCKGAELDIKQHIIQFRPSGIRVQRLRHIPALVAMTTTQIPIVPIRTGSATTLRHLLPSEGFQLQGFPPEWKRPSSRENTFRALGNAVNAELIAQILLTWIGPEDSRLSVG